MFPRRGGPGKGPDADHPNRAVDSCNRGYMPTNHVKFLGIVSLRGFKYELATLGAHQYLFWKRKSNGRLRILLSFHTVSLFSLIYILKPQRSCLECWRSVDQRNKDSQLQGLCSDNRQDKTWKSSVDGWKYPAVHNRTKRGASRQEHGWVVTPLRVWLLFIWGYYRLRDVDGGFKWFFRTGP
jgi:hypothetical protein